MANSYYQFPHGSSTCDVIESSGQPGGRAVTLSISQKRDPISKSLIFSQSHKAFKINLDLTPEAPGLIPSPGFEPAFIEVLDQINYSKTAS